MIGTDVCASACGATYYASSSLKVNDKVIMADDQSPRDRIRALVRDVLNKALPDEEVGEPRPTEATNQTTSAFINTAPKTEPSGATVVRDESSKMVITEDDVRGLDQGAILRIAEGARLTPLAADILNDRKIEIVRRMPRGGSKTAKLIALGADHGGFKMKEELQRFLNELGHRVHDFGTNSED